MVTKVSPQGAFAIATHEALVPTRYRDFVGVDTWGIGHTHHAGDPDPREMSFAMPTNVQPVYDEAWDVFLSDLEDYTAEVVAAFGPNLEQHELDGLVGWHFNTGGALSSSAVKVWRGGDKNRAVRIVKSWNKGTVKGQKVVLPALVERRADDAALILRGEYPKRKLAVYGTDGAGTVIWKPIETFTWSQWRGATAGAEAKKPRTLVGVAAAAIAAFVAFVMSALEGD